jgi:hypothetical protein
MCRLAPLTTYVLHMQEAFVSRSATMGLFFARYVFNLARHPNDFVMLREGASHG